MKKTTTKQHTNTNTNSIEQRNKFINPSTVFVFNFKITYVRRFTKRIFTLNNRINRFYNHNLSISNDYFSGAMTKTTINKQTKNSINLNIKS